jgi:hypothetical protein
MDAYGVWPWVAGLVLALVITTLMFGYADSIS